jgi:DNA-binding SARP family transcriptional activator/tetratricopeptide (TPR) repeat protein
MEGGEMRLCGLGPLSIRDGETVSTIPAHRDRVLLAVLMLNCGQVVESATLVDAVWGEDPPSTARAQVHNCVSRLRRLLPPDALRTASSGYLLAAGLVELDLREFEGLVARARTDVTAGRLTEAVAGFRAALGLWRGAAFAGVDSEVVRAAATSWDESRSRVWEECLDAELALGRSVELVGELTALVHEFPTRERLRGQLMLALYRSGRQADALAVFRDIRRLLTDELGVEPGGELVGLHQRLLRAEEPMTAGPPANGGPPEAPRCLPRDVADFVGREDMLGRLLAWVPAVEAVAGPSVVLAVDGMPGVGKSALATRVAHLVADRYPNGALYLDLHGHSEHAPLDPAAALHVLLRQLDVPGERIPDSLDGRIARWRSELSGRQVLLLLDNAASGGQVTPLLPGSHGCLTLITSRRRLVDLDGARPLSLEVLTAGEAVALLHRIVGERISEDPAGAAEVARLCGYLALAIRLAAARLAHRPTWTVRDLLDRLGSARPLLRELAVQGRSLDAAFALSYQNVGGAERRMFRMLGLHPGEEFDVRAAAALADLDLDDAAVTVESLVDAHLLNEPSAGRYRLHDLLRDYARATAEVEETAENRRAAIVRLLDCYLHTAVEVAGPLERTWRVDYRLQTAPRYPMGPVDARQAVVWFGVEQANLMAAMLLAEELRLDGLTWRLARVLSRPLYLHGYSDDLLVANTAGLNAALREGDRAAEATARKFRAAGYFRRGRYLEAIEDMTAVLACARELGDAAEEANAHYLLAAIALDMVRLPLARDHLRDSLRLFQTAGQARGEQACLCAFGELSRKLGRLDEAMDFNLRALELAVGAQDLMQIAITHGQLGAVQLALGRLPEAEQSLRRSIKMKHELGSPLGEAEVVVSLAELHRVKGDLAAALDLHRRAVDLVEGGYGSGECVARNSFGTTLRLAGEAGAARDQHRQALALALEIRNRFEEARALAGLAELTAGSDLDEAVRLWREALAIFEELGVPERHAVAARLDQDG